MANKQDIITAVKNLDIFLKIPALKGATVQLNSKNTPFVFAGGFNLVFQLIHNSQKWALRVWHVPMGNNKERYIAISKYLNGKKIIYFTDFIYEEESLLVDGDLVDTIRMEWLDGLLLKEYIQIHLNNKEKLEKLAQDFLQMTQNLRKNSISHGDLQEGNILLNKNGDIKLVDYDSVCIPSIEGQKELVTGLKGYQHPSRFRKSQVSLKADYFSEVIIYLSILCIAEKPYLWNKYEIGKTQYLLFSDIDFNNIQDSKIYNDLIGINPLIDKLLFVLNEYLSNTNYLDLKPIESYINLKNTDLTDINKYRVKDKGRLIEPENSPISIIEDKNLLSKTILTEGVKQYPIEPKQQVSPNITPNTPKRNSYKNVIILIGLFMIILLVVKYFWSLNNENQIWKNRINCSISIIEDSLKMTKIDYRKRAKLKADSTRLYDILNDPNGNYKNSLEKLNIQTYTKCNEIQ